MKKDFRKLIIAGVSLLLLGAAVYYITPVAEAWSGRYFNITLKIILNSILLPALWLVLGWVLMQVFGVLGIAKTDGSKYRRPIRIILWVLLLLFIAIQLPFIIETGWNMLQLIRYEQNPALYPDGFSYTYTLPLFLQEIPMRLINVVYRQPAAFTVPGVILWLTRPVRDAFKENADE